jgi:hypothetical protein
MVKRSLAAPQAVIASRLRKLGFICTPQFPAESFRRIANQARTERHEHYAMQLHLKWPGFIMRYIGFSFEG